MDNNQEREYVKKAYPGQTWARKVDRMSNGQVHAIFIRFKNQKKI